MTKYEQFIYNLISSSFSHMTAEEVYEAAKKEYPRVVLATVYNNLNKLCQAGRIRRISVEGIADRFDRIQRHDHLVCRGCGRLKDVQFLDLTEMIKKEFGEDFLAYDLKVFYLCPDCRKQMGDNAGMN